MTKPEFESFSTLFFEQLKVQTKEIIKTIDNNNKVIENYLMDPKSDLMKGFIRNFNTVVVETKVKNYKLFNKVLEHKSFIQVLNSFRNSDVLVRACKAINKDAIKWLLTMDINYEAQDENGTTALMEAAYCPSLNSLLEKLLKYHVDINKTDNNGNTVLFYASRNLENLKKIIKTGIDITHVNKDGETVLSYCAKMNRVRSFEYLKNEKSIDPNHYNCIGRTAAMHLVENAQSVLLKSFINDKNIDPNYKNKFEETLVTTFVKSYYQHYIGNFKDGSKIGTRYTYEKTKRFGETLKTLIDFNCDFNVPVDDDGNTPIMVFLLMKDYVTCQYLLSQEKISIDLSKENYHGVNASYLSLFISSEVFDELTYYKDRYNDKLSYAALKKAFIKNETFDKNYLDLEDDIKVVDSKKIINNYPVTSIYKTIQTWLIEIYYPGAVSEIPLVSHANEDPTSFGSTLTKYNTAGLM